MELNRVFINLTCMANCLLNYNYQYSLLIALYGAYTIENSNQARIFHDEGFEMENKKFKLLNCCLIFQKSEFAETGIKLAKEQQIQIMLSGAEDVLNSITKGLLKLNKISICNCDFVTRDIEFDKKISYRRAMLYKVLTTVIESKYTDEKIEYLSVYDNRYYETLTQNLKRKYKLIYGEEFKDDLYFDIENILIAKKKTINNIKNGGYLKGYGNFNIWIETSIKMQKVAYFCGLGQNNTLGAGALLKLTSRG